MNGFIMPGFIMPGISPPGCGFMTGFIMPGIGPPGIIMNGFIMPGIGPRGCGTFAKHKRSKDVDGPSRGPVDFGNVPVHRPTTAEDPLWFRVSTLGAFFEERPTTEGREGGRGETIRVPR